MGERTVRIRKVVGSTPIVSIRITRVKRGFCPRFYDNGDVFINLLFGVTDATFAFRTTFLASNGVSASQIGLIFSVMSIFSMISPVIGGILADKVLTRRVRNRVHHQAYFPATFSTTIYTPATTIDSRKNAAAAIPMERIHGSVSII